MAKKSKGLVARVAALEKMIAGIFAGGASAKKAKRKKTKAKTAKRRKTKRKIAKAAAIPAAAKKAKKTREGTRKRVSPPPPEDLIPRGEPLFVTSTDEV
jgi:hypothetical protein